ncbi:TetR/AcrR family transcriptional regulator (plasmid) [Rhodococcoides fascians]|uniref:TetR/AcrR family transcriptional regulator n=1 Tax=Rhodococcoides fascians TaxID=1828 RepID=UPI003899E3D7
MQPSAPDRAAVARFTDVAPSDTRERILFALAQSIREKGLRKTQITDVVRHAGASRRTFYRCFADKDSAVVALAAMTFDSSVDYVAAAVDPLAHQEVQIDQGIDAFLDFVAADPILITAIRTEMPIIGANGVRTHLESIDRFASLIVDLLHHQTDNDPTAESDITTLAVMLVTGLDGALARAIAREEPILDLAPSAKLLFRRVLAATSPADPGIEASNNA